MFPGRVVQFFSLEHPEVVTDYPPGLLGVDDVVDEAPLGSDHGVGEALSVVVSLFLDVL